MKVSIRQYGIKYNILAEVLKLKSMNNKKFIFNYYQNLDFR